ncbi:hypothetical protein AGOR_G00220440 [Albula goreensis]|uniref:Fibronectin type-III domain-containing protein n=1 Tax=Albula goreensis TaxID=1534307 RepID=A0A8T3CNB3_9TELE|nr:hypothetical protein AGOR_G00220440 [Albula goreensis]
MIPNHVTHFLVHLPFSCKCECSALIGAAARTPEEPLWDRSEAEEVRDAPPMPGVKPCLTFTLTLTVATALHCPYNVRMDAVNTRYVLEWDWHKMKDTYSTNFTAEYTYDNLESRNDSFRRVCHRTPETHCDFSAQNLSYSSCYALRVRAEGQRANSRWCNLTFCPDEHASLGPPRGVEVQSRQTMLFVIISEPLTVYNTPMSSELTLEYRVLYWERHRPHKNGSKELEYSQGTLSPLQPGTEYCLQVCAFSRGLEKTSPYTSTLCVHTRDNSRHSLSYIMFGLLVCVLLVMGLLYLHRSKIRALCQTPHLPSSMQDPPSLSCQLLKLQEEDTCTAVEVISVQEQTVEHYRPLEDEWEQQDSSAEQHSSGADSGISSGGESGGSTQEWTAKP